MAIKLTVTLGKVPVTLAAESKTALQAEMSNLMSDVRGYVSLQAGKYAGMATTRLRKVRITRSTRECTKE